MSLIRGLDGGLGAGLPGLLGETPGAGLTDIVKGSPVAEAVEKARDMSGGKWQIPDRGDALKLVASDFEKAARELGCDAAAVRAVATVESGGRSGFDSLRRPKIRYENHYFRKLTKQRFDTSHPHLSAAYRSKQYRLTHGKHGDQWKLLREAYALAPEEAVMSVSWGMFQVMGLSYRDGGWTDVERFVDDMFYSEAQHMRIFLGFCKAKGLVKHIRAHQWAAFARGYNGERYRDNAYDVKLAAAWKRYGGK